MYKSSDCNNTVLESMHRLRESWHSECFQCRCSGCQFCSDLLLQGWIDTLDRIWDILNIMKEWNTLKSLDSQSLPWILVATRISLQRLLLYHTLTEAAIWNPSLGLFAWLPFLLIWWLSRFLMTLRSPLRIVPQYSEVLSSRNFSFGQQCLTCWFLDFMGSNSILKCSTRPGSVQNVVKCVKVKENLCQRVTCRLQQCQLSWTVQGSLPTYLGNWVFPEQYGNNTSKQRVASTSSTCY